MISLYRKNKKIVNTWWFLPRSYLLFDQSHKSSRSEHGPRERPSGVVRHRYANNNIWASWIN